MIERLNDAEHIVKDMEKEIELSRVEELIKDNKITFDYSDRKYRIRLLNLKEKEELDMLRRKKFGQLIKDKDILLEKDLIIQYKERGINIDEIDDQIKKVNAEDMDLQVKLGEAISKNEGETILKTYEDQIQTLRLKKQILKTQKNLLLTFCLENQLLNYVAEIITYLSLDELKDGTWQRMFQTLEDFQTYTDEGLINKAGSYSMFLQYL
jgi:DNA-binding transcriptional MerR regulator